MFILIIITHNNYLQFSIFSIWTPVLDLTGVGGMHVTPSGPKFLHFHAVFGKNWPKNRLAPPSGVGTPSSEKSWITDLPRMIINLSGMYPFDIFFPECILYILF